MTDRKQALEALRDQVKAGDDDAVLGLSYDVAEVTGSRGRYTLIIDAFHGSLDAAKVLHDAVLPGFVVSSINWKWGDLVEAHLFEVSPERWHEKGMLKVVGRSSDPARAWLLAILSALISETPDTPKGETP